MDNIINFNEKKELQLVKKNNNISVIEREKILSHISNAIMPLLKDIMKEKLSLQDKKLINDLADNQNIGLSISFGFVDLDLPELVE